jgi:hypothetical protein
VEIILAIVAVVAMVKIANADGRSGMVRGLITLFIEFGCFLLIPWMFIRVLLGLVIAFVAMTVRKGFSR